MADVSSFSILEDGGLEISYKIDNGEYKLFIKHPNSPDYEHYVIEANNGFFIYTNLVCRDKIIKFLNTIK